MKIGISVVTYYPEKNGVQFVTQSLAEGLVKTGQDVTVITKLFSDCDNETCINGVKVIRCDIRNKNMFHFGDKKQFHQLLLELSKEVEVMVFVCLESVAADWALSILDDIKCQKILYMHGMHRFQWEKIDFKSCRNFIYKILRDLRWGIFYKANERRIAKFDKVIHLHEQDDAFRLFEKKYPGKNYVLENFAEDMFFEKVQREQTVSDYFIYISNYHPGKNQMLLLKAIYLMKNDFKLVFVGSQANDYFYKLIELKDKLDIQYNVKKKVEFLYNIDRKEFPHLLQNAYAYIMTSKREVFPITVVEAMASGIPYISTDVGIVKYLPGGIITESNEADIARNMDELLEDKMKYQRLKEAAEQYAENNLIYSKYISKFEKIISDNKV